MQVTYRLYLNKRLIIHHLKLRNILTPSPDLVFRVFVFLLLLSSYLRVYKSLYFEWALSRICQIKHILYRQTYTFTGVVVIGLEITGTFERCHANIKKNNFRKFLLISFLYFILDYKCIWQDDLHRTFTCTTMLER